MIVLSKAVRYNSTNLKVKQKKRTKGRKNRYFHETETKTYLQTNSNSSFMLILLFYFLERALFSTSDNRTVAKLEELWSEDMMSDIVPNNTVCNRKHQNWL